MIYEHAKKCSGELGEAINMICKSVACHIDAALFLRLDDSRDDE